MLQLHSLLSSTHSPPPFGPTPHRLRLLLVHCSTPRTKRATTGAASVLRQQGAVALDLLLSTRPARLGATGTAQVKAQGFVDTDGHTEGAGWLRPSGGSWWGSRPLQGVMRGVVWWFVTKVECLAFSKGPDRTKERKLSAAAEKRQQNWGLSEVPGRSVAIPKKRLSAIHIP